jgi:hypothetical protein
MNFNKIIYFFKRDINNRILHNEHNQNRLKFQNHWDSIPFPLSEILNTGKYDISETGSVFMFRLWEADAYLNLSNFYNYMI